MKAGLERLGCKIQAVNFRSYVPGTVPRALRRWQEKSDLVFIQNGSGFKSRWLEQIQRPVVLAATEYAVESCAHLLKKPLVGVLAHSEAVLNFCKEKKILAQRVHHGYHPEHYRLLNVPYTQDLCFIGGLNTRRRNFLRPLQEHFGQRLQVTEAWDPHEVNRMYNQSRLVLHIHAAETTYVPTRFFEVLPTAGCLLTERLGDNKSSDLDLAAYGEFSDATSAIEAAEHLLSNEQERNRCLELAHRMAPLHSWHGRMQDYYHFFTQVLHE